MNAVISGSITELVDCAGRDRLGFKGRGAAGWLSARGLALPPAPNRLVVQRDGLVVARLGENEFSLADLLGVRDGTIDGWRQALEAERPPACFGVPRADGQAAFILSGGAPALVLSALCPVDLRPKAFGPGQVLQTLCADISAQVWNLSDGADARWAVFCDSSLAHHQRAALQESIESLRRTTR